MVKEYNNKIINNKNFYNLLFVNKYNIIKDYKNFKIYNYLINNTVKIKIEKHQNSQLYNIYIDRNKKYNIDKKIDDIIKKAEGKYKYLIMKDIKVENELTIPSNIKHTGLYDISCKKININNTGNFNCDRIKGCEVLQFNCKNYKISLNDTVLYSDLDIVKKKIVRNANCEELVLYGYNKTLFDETKVRDTITMAYCNDIKINLIKKQHQIILKETDTIEINNINILKEKANKTKIEIGNKILNYNKNISLTNCFGKIVLKNTDNKENIKTIVMKQDFIGESIIRYRNSVTLKPIEIELYNFEELIIKIEGIKNKKINEILSSLIIQGIHFKIINKTINKPLKVLIYNFNYFSKEIINLTKEMLKETFNTHTNEKMLEVSEGIKIMDVFE